MRLLVLFALLFPLVPVQAQETAPAVTPADELIRILEDDTARQALIETLRQAAPAEAAEATPVAPPDLSIARQLAEYTRSVAEGASASVRSFGKAMSNFHEVFTVGVSADADVVRNLAINLSIVVVGLVGSFWLLRLLTGRLTRRIADDAEGKGLGRKLGALLLVGLIDVASIIIAWALGYVLALNTGVNPTGQMGSTSRCCSMLFSLSKRASWQSALFWHRAIMACGSCRWATRMRPIGLFGQRG